MSEPFLGQVLQVAFTFAPPGWALCAGQTLTIAQNSALFALLGTTYGGDGMATFKLPDFQGRVAIGAGHGAGRLPYAPGQTANSGSAGIEPDHMPSSRHRAHASLSRSATAAISSQRATSEASFAVDPDGIETLVPQIYRPAGEGLNLSPGAASHNIAGDLPATALPPYLAITTIIALEGIFPSRG